jgi:hypothetical protein
VGVESVAGWTGDGPIFAGPAHERVAALLVVTTAGVCLVAAMPVGPRHRVVAARSTAAGSNCRQTSNLSRCEVHEAGCVPFSAPFRSWLGQYGEEGVREHGECDLPVPAHVAADFIVVQAAFVLRAAEAFLDFRARWPAAPPFLPVSSLPTPWCGTR